MLNIVEYLVKKHQDIKIDLDNLSTHDIIHALTDKGYKVISNAIKFKFGKYFDNYVVLLKKGSIQCMYVEYHDSFRIDGDELSYAITFSSKTAFDGEAVSANINKHISVNGYEWIKDACEALNVKQKIWHGIGSLSAKKNSWHSDIYSTIFVIKKPKINKLVDRINTLVL